MFERSEVFEKKTVEPCDEKLLEEIQTILTSLYDIDKQLTGVLLSLKIDTNITQEQELCTEDQNKHPKWMECERKKLVNMVKYKLELLHKHVSKDQVVFENYNFSGESYIKQNEKRNTEEDLNEKQMERTQPIKETKLPVSVSNTNVNKNNLDRFTGSKLYLKQNAENTAVDKKVLKDEFRNLKDVALEKHSGMYLLESKTNEPEKEHENLKNESKINVQVDINKELLNQNLTEKEADYLNNITNLTKNLAEAEALVSQLNDKLSSREADLDNRTKEMLNLKQTLTESEEQCNIMKNELFQQKTRIESLVGELEEKIADLRIRNTQHVHMLRKLKEYDDTVKLIGKEKQKLESNAIDNKGRIDEIERNFENKNKHLMHLNECNARLVVEKDKEISVLNELLKQCNNESSDLSKTIDTLSLNIQDKNDQLKQCTQLLNKSESNVREMDISLQTAQAQFEKDLDNMKEVNREKDHLIVMLNEKLAVMEARVKALENEVKGKNDEKIELNAQLQQCLNINDERQLKFEEMVSSKEMYILDLKKEAEQRKTEIHNLQKKLVHESSKKEQTLNVAEKNEIRELKKQLNHALSKLHATESELDDTKTRLSKTMGDRLTDNNPSITDLSDRNRPTKLAEKYSELYDNQWTDAFEILEKYFPNDEGVIETLLHILQETIKFCVNQLQNQMEELGRTLNLADKQEQVVLPVGVLKKLKDIRKAMSISTVGNVRKIFMEYLRQSSDQTIIKALETHEFTFECLEMCWLMMVNDPPVVFAPLLEKGTSFNTDLYKTYTTSGTHVEFVVWPALLLHEGGPVLAKGVAQGFNKSTKTMTKI